MHFTVIIPTFQRRDRVVRTVAALGRQSDRQFDVVVVVDGSTDGSADALRRLDLPFRLTVIEQGNRGAGAARNAGVAAATGECLVFLDDDMEADPLMLLEHRRSHDEGADLVLGDLPLHPGSPDTLLSRGVAGWAESRRARLSAPGAELRVDDLLSGQASIMRAAFERVGGFDSDLTRDGLFGGEDIDFGCRVLAAGLQVAFNPRAVSRQYYDVNPADYLRRAFEAGRSEHEVAAKHPELVDELTRGPRFRTRRSRWLLAPLVAAPELVSRPVVAAAAAAARRDRGGDRLTQVYFAVRTMQHRRGVRAAQRAAATGQVVVLAYHAIADLRDDPVLRPYGIPLARFVEQLDELRARGWTFVALGDVLRALDGQGRLPERALLITFDDAYADILPAARELAARKIPAVAFAVANGVGGTNEWDHALGASVRPLLDAAGLREIAELGVEIGSHGLQHRSLLQIEAGSLAAELIRSCDVIEDIGVARPRAFAYPYGEWDAERAAAARAAGFSAAFTVEPGVVRRDSPRHALPRVEVLADDTARDLRLKLGTARWPDAVRGRAWRMSRALRQESGQ